MNNIWKQLGHLLDQEISLYEKLYEMEYQKSLILAVDSKKEKYDSSEVANRMKDLENLVLEQENVLSKRDQVEMRRKGVLSKLADECRSKECPVISNLNDVLASPLLPKQYYPDMQHKANALRSIVNKLRSMVTTNRQMIQDRFDLFATISKATAKDELQDITYTVDNNQEDSDTNPIFLDRSC